jgi:hypothetical protein
MLRLPRFSVLICIAIVLLFVSAGPVSASPVPQITALSPSGGPITGGTHVTITGSGFTGTTNVQFGGKSVPFLRNVNDRCLTVITPPNPEGTVPLSIINAAGTGRSREAFTRFQYEEYPLPRLSGISPSSGPAAGGTLVTITGSGFTGAENVWFREKDAWDLNVIDDNHLTVRTPAYFPGLVPISVKNAFEIGRSQEPSAMYLYEFPIPELTGISPSSGSTAGYTVVNIAGSGLYGATDVWFGGISGTGLDVIDDNHLTIISPPNPAGTVALSVINPTHTGHSAGSATVFRYEDPVPKLSTVSPSYGSIDGGTYVTLTGSGFSGTKDVKFGENSGTALNITDDRHITLVTPAHSPGSVAISITNTHGTGNSLGPSTMFRYEFPLSTTTAAMKTAAPQVSLPVTSLMPAAATATAAPAMIHTPGFEAIAGISALGARILQKKPDPDFFRGFPGKKMPVSRRGMVGKAGNEWWGSVG